jgi:hypothetical protein
MFTFILIQSSTSMDTTFLDLSHDVIGLVFRCLGNADLYAIRRTCRSMLQYVDSLGPDLLNEHEAVFRFARATFHNPMFRQTQQHLVLTRGGLRASSIKMGDMRVQGIHPLSSGTWVWELDILSRPPIWAGVCTPNTPPGKGPQWSIACSGLRSRGEPLYTGITFGLLDRLRFRLDCERGTLTATVIPFGAWRESTSGAPETLRRPLVTRMEAVREARAAAQRAQDDTDPYGVLDSPFGNWVSKGERARVWVPRDPALKVCHTVVSDVSGPVVPFVDMSLAQEQVAMRPPRQLLPDERDLVSPSLPGYTEQPL